MQISPPRSKRSFWTAASAARNIRGHVLGEHATDGARQLVDLAHRRRRAPRVLLHARAVAQARGAVVAGARHDLRQSICHAHDSSRCFAVSFRPMKTSFLEFEQPIAELEQKIEELRFVQDDSAVDISEEIERLSKKSRELTKEIYAKLTAWQISKVARHPQRPYTLDYMQAMCTDFEEMHGDRAFADDAGDRGRARALQRPDRDGDRPPEGPRHQRQDLPQLRHAAPRGLPQGAAPDEARREVRRAAAHVHRHARRVSRHRRRGARPVGSDRQEPLCDGGAARAGRGLGDRRGRLGRRARDRRGRRDAHDAVLDLFGDLARGLRRDPLEERGERGRGRREPRHHRARA